MLNKFKQHIETNLIFLKGKKLLIACSGGVDSVVLTHLCHQSGLDICLAHCNFNLRGGESDKDEEFVKVLGEKLGINVSVKVFDTLGYMNQHGGSIQMAARALRYQWFNQLLETEHCDFVLTAHHIDDNLETFIINLSRGTGIEGLTGIPQQNDRFVRPLLRFSREEIENYAKSQGIKWREDSSNVETKYLRNKIRLELVPKLKELHPTFLSNFTNTQAYLKQTQALATNDINAAQKRLFRKRGDAQLINVDELKQLKPTEAYLYGLFHKYGFTEWDNIKNLLEAMSGKELVSKTHRLLRDRTHLILSPLEIREQTNYAIVDGVKILEEPIRLKFEMVSGMQELGPNTIFLDKEKLNFPLVLRNWQKGDYFYPFGMKGRKKLSKFFKDEKIDVITKEKQWLLCSENKIVWVVGRRADERFKVDASTQKILKVTHII
ncbi:tRNA lysidine(34) synthetase TilS [Muricauda sp. JGD-17]|uniref:tRNA(Ile)-lysidine synthase n=1 Tax=Flagellimonas ochracea TaxID=2696472 RepID=A0A964T9P3_9FLAO|nr:tRNA lysidine(34) synthetase TilS [Allomuricauda ochracea]NAY90812.1 tRNA lysidine(34) synthetase TilS [Allomuricauda ochracea]